MTLIRRQNTSSQMFDDQSPTLWDSYVGNWTRYSISGFNNQTATATPTPGASLTFNFTGTYMRLIGALSNVTTTEGGDFLSFPTADYTVDDVPFYSQKPFLSTDGSIVYFQTPPLANASHEIGITVATANLTNQFVVDYFSIDFIADSGSSGDDTTSSVSSSTTRGVPSFTTRSVPSSTTTSSSVPTAIANSTPVGPIVGGIVGGIAGIAIMGIAVWYLLRGRSRGNRDYYSERPTSGGMLPREDHIEPFNTTASTPASSFVGFSGRGPLPSPPGPVDATGPHVPGVLAQLRTVNAALVPQRYHDMTPPGASQLQEGVPPSYTPR